MNVELDRLTYIPICTCRLQWAISIPTEVVAAGIIIQFWAPNLQSWIPALVFIVVLVITNLIGVQVYGELEYWFALIKVITCVLFIFVGKLKFLIEGVLAQMGASFI